MKKLFSLFVIIFFSLSLLAQSPSSFSYQAVARDGNGDILANTNISVRLGVIEGVSNVIFQESHTVTTSDLGLFTVVIGEGSNLIGSIDIIDWDGGAGHSLRVEMDPAGGTSYTSLGESDLQSVPFALVANDMPDLERTIDIPVAALSFNPSSTIITKFSTGLQWESNFANAATYVTTLPSDWDGEDMSLQIFFQAATTSNSGDVDFFIRCTGRDVGEFWGDPGSTNSDGAITVPASNTNMFRQTFTLSAGDFTGKEFIHIYGIQRDGTNETYTGDLIVRYIRIVYGATH